MPSSIQYAEYKELVDILVPPMVFVAVAVEEDDFVDVVEEVVAEAPKAKKTRAAKKD